MKIYITKYATTRGIFEAESDDGPDENGIVQTGRYALWSRGSYCLTLDEAVKVARKAQQDKAVSLHRQLERLQRKLAEPVACRPFPARGAGK